MNKIVLNDSQEIILQKDGFKTLLTQSHIARQTTLLSITTNTENDSVIFEMNEEFTVELTKEQWRLVKSFVDNDRIIQLIYAHPNRIPGDGKTINSN